MTNQEILEKAIQKAIDGGFPAELKDSWVQSGNLHARTDGKAPYDIIFNHDFAKALWGDKEVHHYDLVDLDNGGTTTIVNKPRWHYHLQQMVVADDPIKYLGDNI